jgi:hypothetical protein
MDGDEIDRTGDVAVSQPELPHIGVTHRHGDLRLDLADRPHEVGCRHFASQQNFVTDDDRCDHVRKPLGQRDCGRDLPPAALGQVREPKPLQHLDAVTLGDFGNLVQSVVDGVGAHAVRDVFELGQILVDLLRVDRNLRA